MDQNAQIDQHETTLNEFNPMDHQRQLGLVGATDAADPQEWERLKRKVTPLVWSWYDQHKDDRIATLGGFYRITVSSFRITEMVLTAIFGARPQDNAQGDQGTA